MHPPSRRQITPRWLVCDAIGPAIRFIQDVGNDRQQEGLSLARSCARCDNQMIWVACVIPSRLKCSLLVREERTTT
jgi:hypothetical protein